MRGSQHTCNIDVQTSLNSLDVLDTVLPISLTWSFHLVNYGFGGKLQNNSNKLFVAFSFVIQVWIHY